MPEMDPLPKEALRRAALDARKAYVRTLSDAERALLEQRLAEHLTSLFAGVSVVGGYCPLGSEISPLLAMEEARAVGAIVAYPCFSNPGKAVPLPRRRSARAAARSGSCSRPGAIRSVEPDLVLVPLIAIDGRGTRLGRGKGHYDRALVRLEEDRRAADRRRLAVAAARRHHPRRRVGRPAGRLRSPDGVEWFSR